MDDKRYLTRVDIFANADEALKFFAFAKARGAKTRKEMTEALTAYKKADLVVRGHKEHIEAHIDAAIRLGKFKVRRGKLCN